jgi:glutaminyl-peptide cyclotransferase
LLVGSHLFPGVKTGSQRARSLRCAAGCGALWLAACRAPDAGGGLGARDGGQGVGAGVPYEELGVEVEQLYPHARDAFTEGLVYANGWLYESTGLEGASSLRRIALETGAIDSLVPLDGELFGEGLALVGERFIQLTWRSGRALVWNLNSGVVEQEFHYDGEGWGLCYDGTRLVMSDGSAELQLRDPRTFELIDRIQVEIAGKPLELLNELECVDGEIFANVWKQRHIARIDGASGRVTGWIDTGSLLSHPGVGDFSGADVLNGIAYRSDRDRFLLTGKFWPRVFEVELVPR